MSWWDTWRTGRVDGQIIHTYLGDFGGDFDIFGHQIVSIFSIYI